jgi:hypothetical protein
MIPKSGYRFSERSCSAKEGQSMRSSTFGVLAACALCPCAAAAQVLKVVEVNAPAVNCVFQADCTIPVTDTMATSSCPR